jgi:hypothetical protein
MKVKHLLRQDGVDGVFSTLYPPLSAASLDHHGGPDIRDNFIVIYPVYPVPVAIRG